MTGEHSQQTTSFRIEPSRDAATRSRDSHRKIIFVGGFPIDMTESGLRHYMEAYGVVEEVFIETKGGFSKGFGRVTFKEASVASKVVSIKHALRGKAFTCTYYLTPEEAKQRLEDERRRKIFLSGLKKSTKDSTLQKYFSSFGTVERIIINRYKDNTSKGTAFILFSSEDTIEHLLSTKELKTHNIDGAWTTVFQCLSKNDIISFTTAINHDSSPTEVTQLKAKVSEEGNSAPRTLSTSENLSNKMDQKINRHNLPYERMDKKISTKAKPTTYSGSKKSKADKDFKNSLNYEPHNLQKNRQMPKEQNLANNDLPFIQGEDHTGDHCLTNLRFNFGPMKPNTPQQLRYLRFQATLLGNRFPAA